MVVVVVVVVDDLKNKFLFFLHNRFGHSKYKHFLFIEFLFDLFNALSIRLSSCLPQ